MNIGRVCCHLAPHGSGQIVTPPSINHFCTSRETVILLYDQAIQPSARGEHLQAETIPVHRDLSVIIRRNLKVSRDFLLNTPEARAWITILLGLGLLQQWAGEKQAEGKEGLGWDGGRKEERLGIRERSTALCHADHRTVLGVFGSASTPPLAERQVT